MEQAIERDERFEIDNDELANWALKKIKGIRGEANRQITNLDREIARYEHEKQEVKRRSDNEAAYFESLLSGYMIRLGESGAIKYTKAGNAVYRLPDGKIKYTGSSQKLKHDDEKLLTALNNAGRDDLIKVRMEPKWAEVKKIVKIDEEGRAHIETVNAETGEIMDAIIAGVAVETVPPTITVEVSEG